ncbi:MAG: asparaginase, partial [Acidimicrobiales bacterium]|nr:asparaginase [Acidimicrobiales bacterium]
MNNPLIVEVTRGSNIESVHLVDVALVDSTGNLIEGWGEPSRPTLPRSSLKPIQATPLITEGVADSEGLGAEQLAVACSSHSGEAAHVQVVDRWLERLGFSHNVLECGAHVPSNPDAARDLVLSGIEPDSRHNNCSGKHTGFVSLSKHFDLDVSGYISPEHPVMKRFITPAIQDFCRIDLSDQVPGVDGCGVPVWSIPLDHLAGGWSQLRARGSGRRLLQAMTEEPFLVAGTDRACTRLMEAAAGDAAVKTGAEGVYCGVDLREGFAFALKARDGQARAAEVAAEWVLDRLGCVDFNAPRALQNWAGTNVGEIRV